MAKIAHTSNHRWRVFSVLAMMYVLAYFYRISMAVVARDVAADLSLSAARLGTLSGIFFYVYAFSQIPLGPVLDRFGGRRVISLYGVMTAVGGFLFAFAPNYPTAITGRILIGIGTGCVLMGSLKIFTNWFTAAEFGRISGFMVAVGNIGNLAATAPLAAAAGTFGWRSSFAAVAVVQAAATVITFSVARDVPPGGSVAEDGGHHEPMGMWQAWHTIGTNGSFWLLGILSFFWYACYMSLQGLWGGPYLIEAVGMTRESAGNLLLWTSVGFIAGCLFLGRLTDLIGSRKRTMLLGQGILALLMTVTLGPAETLPRWGLYPLFFATGLAVSTGITIYPVIREMFPHSIVATAMTSLNFFVLMGAAVVQQGMGFIIGRFPKALAGYPPAAYHRAFLLPTAGLAVAVVLFSFFREKRK